MNITWIAAIQVNKKSRLVLNKNKCIYFLTYSLIKYRIDVDIAIFRQHHIDIVPKSKQ